MKKRIICLILVIATLTLSLASCGSFNFWEDDLAQYVTFDKNKFAEKLISGEITIDDGTFTENAEVREKKVIDSIYSTLGSKTDKTNKLTVGTPNGYDLFYYAYYITATVDGNDYVFTVDTMAKDKAEETQFGLNFNSDLEEKVVELFEGYKFASDKAYVASNSGNAEAGQLAFVSYTRTYYLNDANKTSQTVEATKHPILLNNDDLFAAKLIGQPIGSTIDSIKVEVADAASDEYALYAGEYTQIKIEWVADAAVLTEEKTFEEVTYTEAKTMSPTLNINNKKSVDLKGAKLTYHVFPASFVEVEDYTATAVINTIYADSVSYSNIAKILVGPEFSEMTAEEQEKAVAKYKFEVDGEENVTLEEFVTILKTAQKTLSDKKSANTTAKTAYDEKQEAYNSALKARDDAEKIVTDAGDEATEEQKNTLADKETALETAEAALNNAKKTYEGEDGTSGSKAELENAENDRKEKVDIFFKVVTADAIREGYKENIVFDNLLTAYNTEIKNAVAEKVYALMTDATYLTLEGRPQSSVDEAVEYLVQNYQYCFYNNVSLDDSSTDEDNTFYKKYNGSFQTFLINYAVPTDLGVNVSTYEEAMSAIGEAAAKHIDTKLAIYAVASAYGKVVTDEVYDAYIESEDYDYTKEAYNGAEAARLAYQFDYLMNYLLETTESDDGKLLTWVRVKFERTPVEDV